MFFEKLNIKQKMKVKKCNFENRSERIYKRLKSNQALFYLCSLIKIFNVGQKFPSKLIGLSCSTDSLKIPSKQLFYHF